MNTQEIAVAKAAVDKFRMEKVRKYLTPEAREKARVSRIGLKRSVESKERMRQAALGRKHSDETKQKIREARSRQKVTQRMLDSLENNRGEKSLLWKGSEVGYRALHRWVENHLGKPEKCDHCQRTNLKGHDIHWANKSNEYHRDLMDWIRLCALCHKKFDREVLLA